MERARLLQDFANGAYVDYQGTGFEEQSSLVRGCPRFCNGQQILSEVVKAHADAVSSLDNLAASEELIEAAQASVESSRKRYDKGAADILELLSTQAALADARQERIRCLAEWQAARLKLLASAGILRRDQNFREIFDK